MTLTAVMTKLAWICGLSGQLWFLGVLLGNLLIPQCTSPISHNASFWNRNVHMCAHFCYKIMHCGIFVGCIGRFVRWVGCISELTSAFLHITARPCIAEEVNIIPLAMLRWRMFRIKIWKSGFYLKCIARAWDHTTHLLRGLWSIRIRVIMSMIRRIYLYQWLEGYNISVYIITIIWRI